MAAIGSRRARLVAIAGAVLVLFVGTIVVGRWLWLRPFTEDGYYDLTIARQIALGNGVTIDGHTWTNGFQPLWVFVLVPIYRATGGDRLASLPGVLALSVLTWVATAAAVASLAHCLAPRPLATMAAVYGFALYFVTPSIMKQHLNGLETGLLLLIFALIGRVMAAAGPWTRQRTARLALLAGLIVLTRIDAVMFVPLLALAVVVRARGQALRVRVSHGAAVCAGAAVVSSPWWLYNQLRFGRFLPSSGSATFDWHWRLDRAWLLLLEVGRHAIPTPLDAFWRAHYSQVGLSLGVLAFVCAGMRLVRDADLRRTLLNDGAWLFVASILTYAAALVLAYAMTPATWMYERYTSPVVIASVPLSAVLMARLLPDWRVGAGLAAGGAALLALFVVREVGSPARNYYRTQIDLVRRHVPSNERVGAFQSGTLGYYRDGVVNLDGKVNVDVLRAHSDINAYTRSIAVNWVVDWQWRLDDGFGSMADWRLVERAEVPGCPLCNFSLYVRGSPIRP